LRVRELKGTADANPLNINPSTSSDGVLGFALDPIFKLTHRVFIFYTFVSATGVLPPEKSWRVSRFTLNAAHDLLDLSSKIPILKVAINSGSKHPGGAMQFDAYGDFWITTSGTFTLEVRTLLGQPVAYHSGKGRRRLSLNEIKAPGIYFVSARTKEGSTTRKFLYE
jgi:hypothetical protein